MPPCEPLHASAQTQTQTQARIVIHAARRRGNGGSPLLALRQRIRDWAAACRGAATPVNVRIADLHGHQLFSADAKQPLLDVPLPAGTYDVTVSRGAEQRRYTVALAQGATFDLHLRMATGPV